MTKGGWTYVMTTRPFGVLYVGVTAGVSHVRSGWNALRQPIILRGVSTRVRKEFMNAAAVAPLIAR